MVFKVKPRVGGAAMVGQVTKAPPVELPEIQEVSDTDVRASVLLQGDSGTGKTFAIGQLLKAGYNGLIVAVEPKVQAIMRYKPKVLFLTAPVKTDGGVRQPTPKEVYDRLQRFRDLLGEGAYREHGGKPLDFIAIDGFLELGEVIYKYWKANKPTASSTGADNSYAMWDNIAEKSVDFFKSLRDAAGVAAGMYGLPPIGVVATIGEQETSDKMGCVRYVPLFPGKKGGTLLPYAFEAVIRLSVRNVDGEAQYIAHTVGQNDPNALEKFYAKCPSGVFESEVVNPDFGEMYGKLLASYKADNNNNDSDKE